jgi:hypothetical protein
MDVKGMISTGAMVIIGIIALKAFGGVKGITSMIGGIGDLLGTGGDGGLLGTGGAGAAPAVGIIAPETAAQIDIISDMTLPEVALIAETQEIEGTFGTLQNLSLIGGPLAYIAAPYLLDPIEESYKAETIKKYVQRTAATPQYEPSAPETFDPTYMVSDVGRITEPLDQAVKRRWIGGR